MKNMNSNFNSLNDILGGVVQKLGIDRGMQQITFLNFWPQVVGPRFSDKTKAISVSKKGHANILVVAVASSALAQELNMFKLDILKKLYPIAKSLDLDIKDIVFNFKIWEEVTKKDELLNKSITESYLRNPSDEDLKDIEVPETIIEQVKESVNSQKFSDKTLKNRMIATALRDVRVQIWKKNNGYPFCEGCGIPLNYRPIEGRVLCPACKFSLNN